MRVAAWLVAAICHQDLSWVDSMSIDEETDTYPGNLLFQYENDIQPKTLDFRVDSGLFSTANIRN